MKCVYFCLLFIFSILVPSLGRAQDSNVINLNEKWHFAWVGDIYSDLYSNKNSILLCVQTNIGQYALWNPLKNILSVELKQKCHRNHGLRRIKPEIMGLKVSTTEGDGKRLFDYYYTIMYPDGHEGSFYIFGRLKSPHQQDENRGTLNDGKDAKFSQDFAETLINSMMTLEDGSLLFVANSYTYSDMCSACRDEFGQPTLLRFKDAPVVMPPLGMDTFVIPKALLDPVFSDPRNNDFARYNAVMAAIGKQIEK